MLRTVAEQPSLWEAILPDELRRLPAELARIDELLDDPVFFTPFVPFFDPRIGRPSTPMETYLRLMFLKFRYRLGYESLCREVSDSITWRQFCRIGIDQKVPHPTTLMKLTTRCGSAAVDGLNEALLAKAVEAKVVRTAKIRVDTTVVPANVAYPTDSGLLAKAINRIGKTAKRIKAAGGAVRTKLRDRSRAAGKRAHDLNAKLRTRNAGAKDEALAVVRRKNAELAKLAETAAEEAERLLANAKRAIRKAQADAARREAEGRPDPAAGRRRGRLVRAVNDLTELLDATRRIAAQTRQRLAGTTPDGATRRVSLHDPDARPIAKGRLGRPVEFGAKAQVCDNVDGIVLDHDVQPGNPADAPRLKPAVERVKKRTGKTPRTVAADRGYGEASVDDDLADLGVRNVVIPRKGRPTKARQAHERGRSFRQNVKWRTGCEGRISHLKRSYGWDRTMIDTTEGARTWTGHGVFAHNLTKIATLTA
jgi:transposase, IS5 family